MTEFVVSQPAESDLVRCRCLWDGRRCPNRATQEDGLCDWCGSHGVGVSGVGEAHQRERVPTACWLDPAAPRLPFE